MNPLRYKTLLTYLPGMASVVNSFDSPQVQNSVYEVLMEALDTRLETEGLGRNLPENRTVITPLTTSSGEIAHDLVDGDSIHADQHRKLSKSTSVVF